MIFFWGGERGVIFRFHVSLKTNISDSKGTFESMIFLFRLVGYVTFVGDIFWVKKQL